jgi:dTDP-4-dehydrorhamnose reductase
LKKVLILGGTGMLGHTLFAHLSNQKDLDVYATSRTRNGLKKWFPKHLASKVRGDVNADNFDTVVRALASIQPDIVVNCIGLIKHLPWAKDPLSAITVNAQLPHRISLICRSSDARMIHISTDCVFDGKKGGYKESDFPSAGDLYGRTKLLGEVDYLHCVTLRTSIIGHELKGFHGLIEWFISQEGPINGYTNAIYSGFPTIELAHIISEFVIPNSNLQGVYHVSSEPISKFNLLKLVAERYGKRIKIKPFDDFYVDRSLDASEFKKKTQYSPPTWPELISKMYLDHISASYYKNRDTK